MRLHLGFEFSQGLHDAVGFCRVDHLVKKGVILLVEDVWRRDELHLLQGILFLSFIRTRLGSRDVTAPLHLG